MKRKRANFAKLALLVFTPAPIILGSGFESVVTATASFLNGLFVIPRAGHYLGHSRRNERLGGLRVVAAAAESRATTCREL